MELITLLVAGAAFAGSYKAGALPKDFDAVQYEQVVSITVDATRAIHQCGQDPVLFKRFLDDLNTDSLKFDEYVRHKAKQEDVSSASAHIRKLVVEFDGREMYSKQYCIHKLSEVQAASRTVSRALGGAKKIDICSADLTPRYLSYQQSYTLGLITASEFKELVADIADLKEIDRSGCSLESAAKMDEAIDALSSAASAF